MSSSKDVSDKTEAPRKAKSSKKDANTPNIGSMEDCYTNVFALTEVNGIKWKCYRSPPTAPRGVPLTSDPVLKAYSKCIEAELMCTWRRKQLPMSENHESLPLPVFSHEMQKELWIFWYNEDPPQLDGFCEDLVVDEEFCSSASCSNSVSYEVRTILYKALHVIIERSLMKSGYIRFGRWFTKPLKSKSKQNHFMYPAYTIAFRFNFFAIGGNIISVIVHTQRQPTLIKLHRRHLEHNSMKRFAVIVGPWSMRGALVQNQLELLAEPKMQASAEREYNEWKAFVQLDVDEKPSNKEEPEHEEKIREEELNEDDSRTKPEEPSSLNELDAPSPSGSTDTTYPGSPIPFPNIFGTSENKKKEEKPTRDPDGSSDDDSEYSDDDENDGNDTLKSQRDKETLKDSSVPKMVLVEIDGVRMLYPSVCVCVTLEDDRHVWDALGFRINTVPEELIVQGRRPRNKNVVQSGSGIIPLHGVVQQCALPEAEIIIPSSPPLRREGFAQPIPPINDRFYRWDFQDMHELECQDNENGKLCSICNFFTYRKKMNEPMYFTTAELNQLFSRLLPASFEEPDYNCYHRKHHPKIAQMIRLRDKQKEKAKEADVAAMKAYHAFEIQDGNVEETNESFEEQVEAEYRKRKSNQASKEGTKENEPEVIDLEEESPNDNDFVKHNPDEKETEKPKVFRRSCHFRKPDRSYMTESEPWILNDEEAHLPDWMNCEKKDLPTSVSFNPEVPTETPIASSPQHTSQVESPRSFSPFRPLNSVSPCGSHCKWPVHSMEDMPEEQFEQMFKPNEKSGPLSPSSTRKEKVEEYDCFYNSLDPEILKEPKYSEYHKRPVQADNTEDDDDDDINVRFSKFSTVYSGEMCENGAFGYLEYRHEVETAEKEEREEFIKNQMKKPSSRKQKEAEELARLSEKVIEKSMSSCAKKLVAISDSFVRGIHKPPKCETKDEDITDEIINNIEHDEKLKKLTECPDSEGFPEDFQAQVGDLSPNFSSNPSSSSGSTRSGEESEIDDEIIDYAFDVTKGFGEGTSLQCIAEETESAVGEGNLHPIHEDVHFPCNMEIDNTEQIIRAEQMDICDHQATADSLLSPPASNEMPKSGPLSIGADTFLRGPSSIEGMAMNQIYPTPPSVQMIEAGQMHSPVMSAGKFMKKEQLQTIFEDDGQARVPGELVKIEPMSSDDENEFMVDMNVSYPGNRLRNLMSITNRPIKLGERKPHVPLHRKLGLNRRSSHDFKKKRLYRKMLTPAFENPPFESFTKIIVDDKTRKEKSKKARLSPSKAQQMPQQITSMPPFANPQFPPGHPLYSANIIQNNSQMQNRMQNQNLNPNFLSNQMNATGVGMNMGTTGHFPPQQMLQHPGNAHLAPFSSQYNRGPNNFNNFGGVQQTTQGFSGLMGSGFAGSMGPGSALFGQSPNSNQISQLPFSSTRGMTNNMMNPNQQSQHHSLQQQQQIQMRSQMTTPIGLGSRPPPAYSQPSMPPPQQQQQGIFPGQFMMQRSPQSSVQQLNNFVNQPRFNPTTQSSTTPFPVLSSPSFGGPSTPFNNIQDSQSAQNTLMRQIPNQGISPFGQPGMMSISPMMNSQQQQHNFHLQQQQMAMRQSVFSQPSPSILTSPSVPNHGVGQFRTKELQVPEGESVIIAIIMSDTILDLHFDAALDACPICSCTVSIRARELGLYLTPHEVLRSGSSVTSPEQWSGFNASSTTTCTCGFSAIRHRYLSLCAGLFPEDSNEATACDDSVAVVAPPLDLTDAAFDVSKKLSWFDPSSPSDMALLDQIRQLAQTHSYGKALSQIAAVKEHSERVSKAVEIGMDVASSSEYVISHVDSLELLMLGNSAIDLCMRSMSINRNQTASAQKFLTYFHPWGLQTANETHEPSVDECRNIMIGISTSLENSIRIARSVVSPGNVNIVEGPLTWRKLVQKSLKNRNTQGSPDEESASAPEPIPAVNIATGTESIRTAPTIRKLWGSAQLAPIDQPKDIMYMAIIPDNDIIHSKAYNFMDILSKQYEKMRLGRHIPFPVSTATITASRSQHENPPPSATEASAPSTSVAAVSTSPTRIFDAMDCSESPTTINATIKKPERKLHSTMDMLKIPSDPITEWDHIKKFSSKKREIREEVKTREGILRVGGSRVSPTKFPTHSAAASAEFSNLAKNLNDKTAFIPKLKSYIQQMEEMVVHALSENTFAFERNGFRYQAAIEARAKREREAAINSSGKEKLNAMPVGEDDGSLTDVSSTTPSGLQEANNGLAPNGNGESGINGSSSQANNHTQNAPSPIPAGMMPIPETLPETERNLQPTLTELLAEPSSLLPTGGVTNQWVQMDTTMPNPFPLSNQLPVDYEEVGTKDRDDPSTLPHVIVIYMVNPFVWGTDHHTALHMRVSVLSFIRAFNSILSKMPLKKRPQIQMEIIGMESLDDLTPSVPDYLNDPNIPMDLYNVVALREEEKLDGWPSHEIAKTLSIAVYTHPRVFFPDCYKLVQPRCMTAFGPGSDLLRTVDELERLNMEHIKTMNMRAKMSARGVALQNLPCTTEKGYFTYKVASNLMNLAPPPVVYQMQSEKKTIVSPTDEQTLFVAYCLIGSDFLIATVTDGQGKLIDNCVVNMKPKHDPHQLYRYKQRTQILDAMGRLWTFILGILASDIKNWRLVVGRLGRIGHGEFRAWTHLLNKTSLLKYSTRLKDICTACNQMPGIVGTPAILSACLVTIEPEPSLRLFTGYFDPEFLLKKGKSGQAPDYSPCTHITTFPVGAEINYETQDQSADTKGEENWDFGDLDIMEGLDDGDTELLKDVGLTEAPQSAAIRPGGPMSFFTDETSNLDVQNQPLASGFYISTSPAPELPDWFWASCPSAKRRHPIHLKSSLHINITEVKNDDLTMESSSKEKDKEKEKDGHPLESHQTEEVLRHVLESYNALSWLNVNPVNGEKYSCLPIHIQHLLRLYHSIVRLIM